MADTKNRNKTYPTKSNSQRNKRQLRESSDHILRKRQPRKLEEGNNVLYISSKTNTKAQLERCNQLIKKHDEKEIIIYCLGAAVQRGMLLALQICEQHYLFKIHTNTFTTELIDDLEPAVDDADYEIQKRFNSALRIRVFRSEVLLDSATKDS